jgi:hypothetical protein
MLLLRSAIDSVAGAFRDYSVPRGGGVLADPAFAEKRAVTVLRVLNFIEPVVIISVMLFVINMGVSKEMTRESVHNALFYMLTWSLFISPLIHYPFERKYFLTPDEQTRGIFYYYFECRGLGNPFTHFYARRGSAIRLYWREMIGVALFIFALFCCCYAYRYANNIPPREKWYTTGSLSRGIFLSVPNMAVLGLVILLFAYPFMVRWDNLRRALPRAAAFVLTLISIVFVAAFVFMSVEGWLRPMAEQSVYFALHGKPCAERYVHLNVLSVLSQAAGYSLFGFVQQIIFCSIFAVQFARVFDISSSRTQLFLACLCSGAAFGLAHWANFWLGMLTFGGGVIGSAFFFQHRNVFAFGVGHGLIASLACQLWPISFWTYMDRFI